MSSTYGPQPSSATRISFRSSRPSSSTRGTGRGCSATPAPASSCRWPSITTASRCTIARSPNGTPCKMGPKRDVIGELAAAVREPGHGVRRVEPPRRALVVFRRRHGFDSDVQDPRYAGLYGPAQPKRCQPDEQPSWRTGWRAPASWWTSTGRSSSGSTGGSSSQPFAAVPADSSPPIYYNRGAAMGHRLGAGAAINYKYLAFPEGTAVFDVERGQLDRHPPAFWQTDTSVSKNSWGYVQRADTRAGRDLSATWSTSSARTARCC